MEHIEDLAQRLEEQEDHIQKLEQALNNLGNLVQNRLLPAMIQQPPKSGSQKSRPPAPRQVPRRHPPPRLRHHEPPVTDEPEVLHAPPPHVQFTEPHDQELDEPSTDEEDSDLDAEIAQELEELEEEDDPQGHLKKQ